MTWILAAMVMGMGIPLWHALRPGTLWDRLLAFASISVKSGVLMLAVAGVRGDAFIGLVGVITLSMGNAGLLLLAQLFKRLEVECD